MIVLLMGVSGSGKTTVGKLLAEQLHWKFADADDYHSDSNKAKMHAGIPLTDEDREPWLQDLRRHMLQWIDRHENVVLACSALKESYRDILVSGPDVKLVFLEGSYELIQSRIQHRQRHFMNPTLLRDQFETLERPSNALEINIVKSPQEVVDEIRRGLKV